MSSLFARRDVIVVAQRVVHLRHRSKEDYEAMLIHLHVGQAFTREQLLSKLVDLQYNRNDITFERGQFRVRGDTIELCPRTPRTDCASSLRRHGGAHHALRAVLTGSKLRAARARDRCFPGKQFVTTNEKMKLAGVAIREMGERIRWFEKKREAARSPAHQAAHRVRLGDDGGDGFLLRHRELFAAHRGRPAGSRARDGD